MAEPVEIRDICGAWEPLLQWIEQHEHEAGYEGSVAQQLADVLKRETDSVSGQSGFTITLEGTAGTEAK